jgi:Mn2+/Fe2+ NRAMP family transporter
MRYQERRWHPVVRLANPSFQRLPVPLHRPVCQRPIAGVFTFGLFAVGIIGIGLLAVPVLAGSGAYALGEALGWPTGLDRQPLDAKGFYSTIAVSTLIGILINFVGLDPIKALFWSAVITAWSRCR